MDPNLVLKALRGNQQEVIRPGDVGDDMVLSPDPGYMGQTSPYLFVADTKSVHSPNIEDRRGQKPSDIGPTITYPGDAPTDPHDLTPLGKALGGYDLDRAIARTYKGQR